MNVSSLQPNDHFVARWAIVALSAAAFGSGMSMRVTDPMLLHLSWEFGMPLGLVAWVITGFGLAYGIAQLFFGPLGDRYGKYWVIAWACVACAMTALLCGLVSTFNGLLVARSLAGATAAGVIPLAMAWIGDVVRYEDRQSVLARFLVGQIFGLSAGVMIGGWCTDYVNWRIPFFVIAGWFAIVAVGLLRLNQRLPSHVRVLHKADGHAITRLIDEFRAVVTVSWARTILLTVLLEGAFVFAGLAFLPTHLHTMHQLSLAAAGTQVMLFGIGGLVFALGSKILVRNLGEARLAGYGGACMATAMAVIAYASEWWLTLFACFCFGLGFYMMHNTLQINATQMAPERRGAAVAAFAACFFLGQSFGVAIGGALLSLFNTGQLMMIAGGGVWLTSLAIGRRLRQRPTEQH